MIKLFTASSYYKLFDILSNQLKGKTTDLKKRNLIFCEDKISLMIERKICNDFIGTFNTNVYSFGSFLSERKSFDNILSKEGSIMLIKKILNRTKLSKYKNNSLDLASSFYELIIQLKSAKVSPEQLLNGFNSATGLLKEKLLDMYTVYSEYQKYIKNGEVCGNKKECLYDQDGIEYHSFDDQSSILSYLPDIIKNSDEIKNADVYLFGFESFTAQARSAVKALMENAKTVTAIMVLGDNEFAYVNESAYFIKDYCKRNNIALFDGNALDNYKCFDEYGLSAREIAMGLFNPYHFAKEKMESKNIYRCACKSINEEVKKIGKIIKTEVMSGNIRYKDATIIIPDNEKYKGAIDNIFSMLSIPYFYDEKKTPINLPIVRLILSYTEIFISHFERSSILDFIKNPIICGDKELGDKLEDYILENGISYSKLKKENIFENVNNNYKDSFENIRKTVISLLESFDIKGLLKNTNAKEKCDDFSKTLLDYNEEEIVAVNDQIYDSIEKLLSNIDRIMGYAKIDVKDFKKIFYSGIMAMEISIIPQYNDAVFIGNFKECALGNAKYLFALGLDSKVPQIKEDIALLSDADIKTLADISVLVEPEIRIINKRAKEQTLLGLSAFSDKLFVTYPTVDEEGKALTKSEIIVFLESRFDLLDFPKEERYLTYREGLNDFAKDCSMFSYGLIDEMPEATSFYCADDKARAKSIMDYNNKEFKKYLESRKDILIKRDSSPTALESFASCPYKYFVNNVLKVRDKNVGKASYDIVGKFVHDIFTRYFGENRDFKSEEESSKYIDCIYEDLQKEGKYKEFYDVLEEVKIQEALRQSKKFCYRNYLWLKNSAFKTNKNDLEVGVSDNGGRYNSIKILNDRVKLNGRIDRVDTTSNGLFRIIDYKTGKYSKELKSLFTGKNIQLYLYALAVSEKMERKEDGFVGAYYCPISDEYGSDGDSVQIADGITVNEESFIKDSDKNYSKENGSGILGIAPNKKDGLISNEAMKACLKYSKLISEKMANYMLDGLIIPSPYQDSCKYCQYNSMCMTTLSERIVNAVNGDEIIKFVNSDSLEKSEDDNIESERVEENE